jgi:hypothetical protein
MNTRNRHLPASSAPNIIGSGSHNTINAPAGTGLTKREAAAIAALQGLLASPNPKLQQAEAFRISIWAVAHADGLFDELESTR